MQKRKLGEKLFPLCAVKSFIAVYDAICWYFFKAHSFEVTPVKRFLVHSHFSDLLHGRRKKQKCRSELAVVPRSPPCDCQGPRPTGTGWLEEKGLRTEPHLSAAQTPSPVCPFPTYFSYTDTNPMAGIVLSLHRHRAHAVPLPLVGRADFLLLPTLPALSSECHPRCHRCFCVDSNTAFPFSMVQTFALMAQKPSWVKTAALTCLSSDTSCVTCRRILPCTCIF